MKSGTAQECRRGEWLRHLFRVLLMLALVAITVLATTDSSMPLVESVWDKANHFVAFLVLGWLADFAFPRRSVWPKITGLLIYGVLIEIIQQQLPYRDGSALDIVADSVGLLTYFVMAASARRKLKLRHSGVS